MIARRLLAELADEDGFDRAIGASTYGLAALAAKALDDDPQDLDPDAL